MKDGRGATCHHNGKGCENNTKEEPNDPCKVQTPWKMAKHSRVIDKDAIGSLI